MKFKIFYLLLLRFTQACRQKNLFVAPNYNLPPAVPVGLRVFAANDGVVGIEWYKTLSNIVTGCNIYRNINNYSSFTKILAIDKGNLKSSPTKEISDVILDKPKIIYPPNNGKANYFYNFKIRTVSLPAQYKIVIQSNKLFGTVDEIPFHPEPIHSYYLSAYKKYYLRLITYTDDNKALNSYSELTDFTIIPK